MSIRSLAAIAVLVCPAFGAEKQAGIPAVSYEALPLPVVRTDVSTSPGTPARKANLNSPFPDDFPPSLVIDFENANAGKYRAPKDSFPSHNILRIYRITDIQKAPYKTIQAHLAGLRKVLEARPAELSGDARNAYILPDYPPRNSAHGFDLHLRYVDAPWGSGICYLTLFTQDGSNHADEGITYLFQGLSKDGAFYVSADFFVTHSKLKTVKWPKEMEKGDYDFDCKLLNSVKADTFTPSLLEIEKWLASLKIK